MGFCRRVLLGIIRRPFRSFSLLFLIIVVSLLGIVGSFLTTIVSNYETVMHQQVGLFIGLSRKSQTDIPQSIIGEISQISNIAGYNASSTTLVMPSDFKNTVVPQNDKNAFTQMEKQEQVRLVGNIDTEFYDTFRKEDMKLTSGDYPNKKNKGVIVDQYLADQNNLYIGSTIQILNLMNNDLKIDLTIVGIYQTYTAPEESWTSGSGNSVYSSTPYSYLFCDVDSYNKIIPDSEPMTFINFYVDKSQNLNSTLEKIRSLPLDWNEYSAENVTQSSIDQSSQVIQSLNETSTLVLTFSYLTAIGILFLMTLLWMRDHINETGIYIALGTSRLHIAFHFFMEIIIISILALSLSLAIGSGLIFFLKDSIIDFTLKLSSINIIQHSDLEDVVIQNSLSVTSLLKNNLYFLGIACMATLCSSFIILRYKPRQLFNMK